MGSGMVPTGLGFMLQDRGELFDLTGRGHANTYAPGKRPFHTIIPAFVTRVRRTAFGVMGGATQPQAHAQILIHMLDFRHEPAGGRGRGAHRAHQGLLSPPPANAWRTAASCTWRMVSGPELPRRTHQTRPPPGTVSGHQGGYQAILWDAKNRVYQGASESRKDGFAAGY
ncbi:MAG: gamma-glutamyltransferase [Planctomycetota bacterium]